MMTYVEGFTSRKGIAMKHSEALPVSHPTSQQNIYIYCFESSEQNLVPC